MGRDPVRDLADLQGYVRFYLTVTAELEKAEGALAEGTRAVEEALAPHRPLVAEVPGVLAAALVREGAASALASLWRPLDEAALSGLGDVYEVVGRFSFQGTDDENLARVSQVTGLLQRDAATLAAIVAELQKLPDALLARAAALGVEEAGQRKAHDATVRRELAPLLDTLRARALQAKDALAAVPLPDVGPEETAKDAYAAYVARVAQTWATCLPFLEKSLAALAEASRATIDETYPAKLPFVAELPEELLVVAEPGAEALAEAKRAEADLAGQLASIDQRMAGHTQEVAAIERGIEGEKATLSDLEAKVALGQRTVELAQAHADVARADELVGSYETQRASRLAGLATLREELGRIEVALGDVRKELTELEEAGKTKREEHEEQKGKEPLVFGKDAYRKRMLELEEGLEDHDRVVAEKTAEKQRLKIEWSRVAVAKRTEEDQIKLLEQWSADAKEQRKSAAARVESASRALGAARPAVPPSVADAGRALTTAQTARADAIAGIEALLSEVRTTKEEIVRLDAKRKSIAGEHKRLQSFVESAAVSAREGKEAGRREMARQRHLAVVHHVEEVLGALFGSLEKTDEHFGEPIFAAIAAREAEKVPLSTRLAEAAQALAGPAREVAERVGPQAAQIGSQLAAIRGEFCDVAKDVCARAFA